MPVIFISYRREDSAGHAGRLCDLRGVQQRLRDGRGLHRHLLSRS
jgi:hypothetical protein